MLKTRRLNSAVAARVRKLRRRSECIWYWSDRGPTDVVVHLIARRSVAGVRRMIARFGLGGHGRALVFRKVGGRWSLAGQGRWIS
jgi:hypothetical protein